MLAIEERSGAGRRQVCPRRVSDHHPVTMGGDDVRAVVAAARELLLWATGRGELPGRDRLTRWRWHCTPLDEGDGTEPV